MKKLIKWAIIGLIVWAVLVSLYYIGGNIGINPCESYITGGQLPPPGMTCETFFASAILIILSIIDFIGLFFGSPLTAGVRLFFSAISFILWGVLIGWIIEKIKQKR